MDIVKVDKEQFYTNLDFFKRNLPFVYNLYENTDHPNLTKEEIANYVLKGFQKFFNENMEDSFLIIATKNNFVYSIAAFEHHKENYWYIDSMETKKEARGQHLATNILKKGLNEINGKCYLHVDKNNIPAISLYKKMGFQQDSVTPIKLTLPNSYLLTKNICKIYKTSPKSSPKEEYIIC